MHQYNCFLKDFPWITKFIYTPHDAATAARDFMLEFFYLPGVVPVREWTVTVERGDESVDIVCKPWNSED